MIAVLTSTLRRRLERVHDDEGGAILLAALAATMILFMTSLVLYDAGEVAREKVRLQTAADSAAYSQAAIKARTMNMNAYANVTKRSIVGLSEMYHASFSLFYRSIADAATVCSKDPSNPDETACTKAFADKPCAAASSPLTIGVGAGGGSTCGSNWEIAFFESTGDWDDIDPAVGNSDAAGGYAGVYKAQSPITGLKASVGGYRVDRSAREPTGAMLKYNKELQQITRHQEYMQKVTPWWAHMEAVTRGNNNGASMTMSFPPPEALNTPNLPAWVNIARDRMLSAGYASPGTQFDQFKDWSWRDDQLGRQVSLATNIRRVWNGAKDLNSLRDNLDVRKSQSSDVLELCWMLRPNTSPGSPFYADESLAGEMNYNFKVQKEKSEGDAALDLIAGAFFQDDDPSFGIIGGYSLCAMSMLGTTSGDKNSSPYDSIDDFTNPNYVPAINSYFAAPYIVTVDRDRSALDMMRLSNITFTYREGEQVARGRERFRMLPSDYDADDVVDQLQGAGTWTMARSEIVTHGQASGPLDDVYSSGEWHANWTGRMRPVSLPGEMSDLGALVSSDVPFLNGAFYASVPLLGIQSEMGLAREVDLDQVYDDFEYMQRATSAMDDGSAPGLFK